MIDLLRRINSGQVFSEVERNTKEVEKKLNSAILEMCHAYQVSGYLQGVNDGLKLANTIDSKSIEVTDILTGEKIV